MHALQIIAILASFLLLVASAEEQDSYEDEYSDEYEDDTDVLLDDNEADCMPGGGGGVDGPNGGGPGGPNGGGGPPPDGEFPQYGPARTQRAGRARSGRNRSQGSQTQRQRQRSRQRQNRNRTSTAGAPGRRNRTSTTAAPGRRNQERETEDLRAGRKNRTTSARRASRSVDERKSAQLITACEDFPEKFKQTYEMLRRNREVGQCRGAAKDREDCEFTEMMKVRMAMKDFPECTEQAMMFFDSMGFGAAGP